MPFTSRASTPNSYMDRRTFISKLHNKPPLRIAVKPFSFTSARQNAEDIPTSSLEQWQPTVANPWDASAVKHLYNRLGFGVNFTQITKVLLRSPHDSIEELMHNDLISDHSSPIGQMPD